MIFQQYQYGGSGGYNYPNSTTERSFITSSGFKKLNGFELILIVIMVILIIGIFLWGFLSSNTQLRDQQRLAHIEQVVSALNEFYKNSSLDPAKRAYPISQCSTSLNEVDFELIVRRALTGQSPELDPHTYINPDNFPRDPWGVYHSDFSRRRVEFRCPRLLPVGGNQQGYEDGYESCNFSSTRNLNLCYLYSSSNNGDSFQIGYWSEVNRRFVVFSRFREDQIIQVS